MKIEDKLIELGFEKINYEGKEYLALYIKYLKDRAGFEFRFHIETNMFFIDRYKRSGEETISERELLNNHNDLNTGAKEKWLSIKEELKGFQFTINN